MEICLKPTNIMMENLSRLNKYLIILFCLVCVEIRCQTLEDYKAKYKDAKEIITKEIIEYNFAIKHGKLQITVDNMQESMLLKDLGKENYSETVGFSDLVPISDLQAYSIQPNDPRKIPAEITLERRDNKSSSIFHDDYAKKKIVFRNLEPGSRKIYKYSKSFKDPGLLGIVDFADNLPIENVTVNVVVDKNVEVGYQLINTRDQEFNFSTSEKKGKKLMTWSMSNTKTPKYETGVRGWLHLVPHLVLYVKNYDEGAGRKNLLGNANLLFDYYSNFVSDLNKNFDQDLINLTKDLTDSINLESDKVKAIYYWVKDHIRYIAFESGYEGFIPRQATQVFKSRYGDCKDMASIITAMSKIAGIDSVFISWVGSREIPYKYSEVPTPAADNHMIAVYINNGTYTILDATDKESPFGLPTAFIQGKEAMIKTSEKEYVIYEVPTVKSEVNEIKEQIVFNLENDKILGQGEVQSYGLDRSDFLNNLTDIDQIQRKNIIKNRIEIGNNKFNLTSFEEKNTNNKDLPYIIDYQFELDNYVVIYDDNLFVNLCLQKFPYLEMLEDDRQSEYNIDYTKYHNVTSIFKIPKGYNLDYIPKDFEIKDTNLDFSVKYLNEKNSITVKYQLKIKNITVKAHDAPNWNKNIKTIKEHLNETVSLKKDKN